MLTWSAFFTPRRAAPVPRPSGDRPVPYGATKARRAVVPLGEAVAVTGVSADAAASWLNHFGAAAGPSLVSLLGTATGGNSLLAAAGPGYALRASVTGPDGAPWVSALDVINGLIHHTGRRIVMTTGNPPTFTHVMITD